MNIEIGKEYTFKKTGNKVKIIKPLKDVPDTFFAKKYNGDQMVVTLEFLEEIPTIQELVETGFKKGRGRPKKIKIESNIEEVKIKRPRGRPRKES